MTVCPAAFTAPKTLELGSCCRDQVSLHRAGFATVRLSEKSGVNYLSLRQTIGETAAAIASITHKPHLLENAAPSFETNAGVSKRKPRKPAPRQARMNFAHQKALRKTVARSIFMAPRPELCGCCREEVGSTRRRFAAARLKRIVGHYSTDASSLSTVSP